MARHKYLDKFGRQELKVEGRTKAVFSPAGTAASDRSIIKTICCGTLATISWLCLSAIATATPGNDVQLKIGVVQRFGDEPTDQLDLQAIRGDRLSLKFKSDRQQETLLTASRVKLAVEMQPTVTPVLQERLVLSTHRSFESAEDAATKWRSFGIEVEIAQPDKWEVWATRQVYDTPFLRRLLLSSIKIKGNQTAYLDSQIQRQVPVVNWEVNGKRYSSNQLEVTSSRNLIQVQGESDRTPTLYPGNLRLQPNAYSTYTLVNDVPLEVYLRGVVPHEIGTQAPLAAVEAQAIIARTYVLRNTRRFAIDGYELCADTQCQVYQGLSGTDPKIDRAIIATRGKVLTYDNSLVDALYSSTTGGVTAAFSDVWNGTDRPYLQPVVDAASNIWNLSNQSLADENNFVRFIKLRQGFNETGARMFRWRKQSTIEQITQDLQKFLLKNRRPGGNFTTVQQMQVVERSPGGRILKLAVQTDNGEIILEKDEIRSAFSAPRSTLFYLEPVFNQTKGKNTLWGYAFVGGGLGHGVGLSQIGAYGLANQGWDSSRILNFYYPGTQIQLLKFQGLGAGG